VFEEPESWFFSAWRRRSASPRWRFLRSVLFVLFAVSGLGFAQQSAPSPDPKSPTEQAETLLNAGKSDEALSLLTEIAAKNPKAPGLEGQLGRAYFQLRRYSQAEAHLKNAVQQKADDLESTQLLALSFFSAGNYREALPLLEKLGTRLPKKTPDSRDLLSICYVRTQQWDSARKVLAQMFYVPPDSAMAYLMLGKLLVREQMVDSAVPQIEIALGLDARLAMAHFLLGEIDLYRKNLQDAVTEFQKESAVNPTLWLVYWRLGDAYVRLENYDAAEKALKKAIWLNEASPGAYVLLGEIALKKNDPALASGFLERGLALDPENLDAHDALARAYKGLGRESDANRQLAISQTLRSEKHNSERDAALPLP